MEKKEDKERGKEKGEFVQIWLWLGPGVDVRGCRCRAFSHSTIIIIMSVMKDSSD